MKWKHNLILIFLLLAGVVVGSLLASATAGMPFLGWLSYGGRVGISTQEPMLLDLAVLQVAFGFQLQINVAQIICIIAAICMYKGLANKL
ncbi:MAG: DUF4321 domain-containing protein [Angelakisella sp.]|mgnify:FL=1|jgi:hypothetical protein|nr:DUF4321 domain-containing protein [Angelakisella sp.]MCI9666084.1 DUF4321 domain-containing protein [Angelakisella sp.]